MIQNISMELPSWVNHFQHSGLAMHNGSHAKGQKQFPAPSRPLGNRAKPFSFYNGKGRFLVVRCLVTSY